MLFTTLSTSFCAKQLMTENAEPVVDTFFLPRPVSAHPFFGFGYQHSSLAEHSFEDCRPSPRLYPGYDSFSEN
jgi:hypothetical protein